MTMNKAIPIILKTVLVVLLVLYLGFLYRSDSSKNVPMDEIAASMAQDEAVASLNEMGRADLKHYYQTDGDDTDGFFFYKAASPMSVDEICIMKAPDRSTADTLLQNAQAHLDSQKKVFEGYGTNQTALLNRAFAAKKGDYVYYLCGEQADSWRAQLLNLIS